MVMLLTMGKAGLQIQCVALDSRELVNEVNRGKNSLTFGILVYKSLTYL
jgi:hypothetical protein